MSSEAKAHRRKLQNFDGTILKQQIRSRVSEKRETFKFVATFSFLWMRKKQF